MILRKKIFYIITCLFILLPISLSAQTYIIPGTIEAENYSSMSGIQTEACSEGGENVGWIEAGDWMDYPVNITAGTYTVSYRVASLSTGGSLSLQIGGTAYNTVSFGATGGWQTWTTVTGTATLPGGNQTIRIYANQTGWNINWFSFTGGSTATSTPTPQATATPVTGTVDITNLGGTVSAQYTDSPSGEEIDKLIDNTTSTKYLTFHASGWVQYQMGTGYIVTSYSISSANDAAERDPFTWTLQGSTNGSSWATLDSRSGEDFPNRFQTRSFSFSNSASYTHYRLDMTNNSGTILQLSEWELFGVQGSGTATSTPTPIPQATSTPTPIPQATATPVAGTVDITNLGGTISAEYTDSPSGEEIDKLIDNTTSTKYLTFHASGWVQYQAGTGYVVTGYSISSANDAAERDPYTWTLQGSVNGSSWATLDSRSGEDFPNRFQTRSFTFANNASYTYYRLDMTNNSGTILQLSEWEIFGVQGPGTATSTPTQIPQATSTPTATPRPTATSTTPPSTTNIALNKVASSSSNETTALTPNLAVDGNTGTRWASAYSDPQWIQIDLGATATVGSVVLRWEAAYASAYQIQISSNASSWTTLYTTTTGSGGNVTINVSGSGRYIRMYGTARGTEWGYSLWEFEVYGTGGATQVPNPTATATRTPTPTATPTSGTVPSGQIFFDDFSYSGPGDPVLTSRWSVRSGSGGPGPSGCSWSTANVSFLTSGTNKIMQMRTYTSGTAASTVQSEVWTNTRKFLHGTYAAYVYFTDAPVSGPDGDQMVETFFTITPLNYSMDPAYSECDFEYLPNGGWGVSGNTMWYTTWETYQPDPWIKDGISNSTSASMNGWKKLLMTMDGTTVRYYVDGVLVASHADKYYPETLMSINFNLWIIAEGLMTNTSYREYIQQVDWMYHKKNTVMTQAQVDADVQYYRNNGITVTDGV